MTRQPSRSNVLGCALLALVASAWASSCRPADEAGTSLLVNVEFDSTLEPTQLRFAARQADVEMLAPVTLPETPAETLTSGQSLRILLPDSLDQQDATVSVEALADGGVVAQGQSVATVAIGHEVAMVVTLATTLGPPDAGGPDAETPDAGATDAGSNDAGVPDAGNGCDTCAGCCKDNLCHTAELANCGAGGGACSTCSPTQSDQCAQGTCRCGATAPCAAGLHCSLGQCVCDGTSCPDGCCQNGTCVGGTIESACGNAGQLCRACPAAETCLKGVCNGCIVTCTAGCCSGSTCVTPTVSACGVGGAACTACNPLRADSCSAGGACRCGSTAPCADGQRCANGLCVCDATSCPSGCCQGSTCQIRSMTSCGSQGSTCVACPTNVADNCGPSGTCRCGPNGACTTGQRCLAGNCVCDNTTCSNGCCAGNVCSLRSLATCGPSGGVCTACDLRSDSCSSSGQCRCGPQGPCSAGQACVGGHCTCSASSCPGGCCNGNTCTSPRLSACGTAGANCVSCDSNTADTCGDGGTCRCGASAPCGGGQRCVQGQCVCNATSCPNGCCNGTSCTTLSLAACGAPGAACSACDSNTADTCSAAGACQCGTRAACGPGQRCSGGNCVCDATSCPQGCCDQDTCQPGDQPNACGAGGALCQTCGAGLQCDAGTCS